MNQSLADQLNNGLTAHREGRLSVAASAYENVLAQSPKNFDALQLLGMLRHQQGRFREAARLLEKAVEERPGDVAALNKLSAVLLADGDVSGAARIARAVLAEKPSDAFALYNLASAQRLLGQIEEAATTLDKALTSMPDAPDAWNLLGIVRHQQHRYADAARHFEHALSLRPGHPEYLNNLGFALLEGGQAPDARPYFEAAVAARPAFGEALFNLGRTLHELGLDAEAVKVFDAARKADPDAAAIAVNLGISLQALNRFSEAEEAFSEALSIDHKNTAALARLAALYESSNRLGQAREAAGEGLALDPDDPFLNLVAARCERRDGRLAEAAARIHDALAATEDEQWAQPLLYELSRIEDMAENFGKAIEAAERANRMASAGWRRLGMTGNPYNRMVDGLANATRQGWIDRWRPLADGAPGPSPVFLLGFPRSGTTLLDTIIGSHPDFTVLEERPALEGLRRVLDQRPGGFIEALAQLDEPGRASLLTRYWHDAESMLDEPLAERRLLDKLPLNLVLLPLIQRVFPDAKIVVALRHPADVCLSCFFQEFDYRQSPAMANFFSLQDAVGFYGKVFELWTLYQNKLSLQMHTVRYEDLVEDLEQESRRLFEFLGSPWDRRVLEYHREARRRGTIDTPSYHQVSQPIYTRARYRWRSYEFALAPWLDTLHAWAAQLGYQRPPETPGKDE